MDKITTITEQKDGRIKVDYRFTCDRLSRSVYADGDFESFEAAANADELSIPGVGSIYMVGQSEYVGPNRSENYDNNPNLFFELDNGEGWSGNSDRTICRYHGWRGTSDDWSFYGLGVRRCLAVRRTGKRSQRVVIVFGRDLKTSDA